MYSMSYCRRDPRTQPQEPGYTHSQVILNKQDGQADEFIIILIPTLPRRPHPSVNQLPDRRERLLLRIRRP